MLRQYINPTPNIGEYLELDLPAGSAVSDVINILGIPLEEVAIIMVDYEAVPKDFLLQAETRKVALFPVSGGG